MKCLYEKSSCDISTRTLNNFCSKTGQKNNKECPKCWVKNNQPYNCGLDNCPGIKLHRIELDKSIQEK